MADLTGTSGNDNLKGTLENDQIFGLEGNDTIQGLALDDFINGNTGADVLFGGGGNDTIHGGKGNDIIKGGGGNDEIWGDFGNDTLTGDTGNDVFVLDNRTTASFNLADADVITDFSKGTASGDPQAVGNGRDFLGLTEGLTYDDLYITQGVDNYANSLIIQEKLTGKYLAVLQGYSDRTTIAKDDFIASVIAGSTVKTA